MAKRRYTINNLCVRINRIMSRQLEKHLLNEEESRKITIIVADDHPLLRQALRDSLNRQPDLEVIAEAIDGEEAVRLTTELIPDVVIMDIGMPKLNGLEATRRIKELFPRIAVLTLTVYDDNEHILSTLESGAAGYLTKSASDVDVILAIRAIASGEIVISPQILHCLLSNTLHSTKKPGPISFDDKFSIREMQVLRLAAKSMHNKEIATQLGISVRTVKGYWESIFSKLRAGSRTEAIILCLQNGFLKLDELSG